MLLAVPAALAIARYRFPGRAALTSFFLSPMMIPAIAFGIAFLRFLSMLNLSGSFRSLVYAHVVIVLPYAMRLALSSAVGLDRDAERAALSCGASRFTTFRRVVLPMIRTGVAGGWVLYFIQSFDEFTMTIFVATPGTTTLPVAMYNQIAQTIDPLVASVSAVLIVGTVLLHDSARPYSDRRSPMTMTSSSPEVLVLGGGLVGSAVAYGLAREDARVTVLDEDDGSIRASRGNFGLV